jgi:type I restriction enzyme, S subunit
MNELPEGWEWKKLGEILNFTGGGTPDKSNKSFWNGAIPWASVKDIKEKYLTRTQDFISEHGLNSSSSQLALPGELILITRISPGKTSISKIKAAINQDLKIVKPKIQVDTLFTHYLFETIEKEIIKKSSGTTVLGIRLEILKDIDIPLPPLPVQHAIVTKIEEIFSELDHGVEQLKTARAQLKVYRQAVLKWAFEGRLTNEGVLDGELPDGWKWVKTGEVINTINNGYTPTKEFLSEGSGEIPFIKVYNLNFDGTLNFKKNPTYIPTAVHQKDLKRSVCYPGDVLINIVGPPLGKVSVVTDQFPEWNINQAIVLFRPNEKVTSKFIAYFMQNSVTINWLENTSKATAGQWNVKVSTCREIPIPLPPLTEQHQIVSEIERRLSVCDKLEETIEAGLKQAEVLRAGVLKMAFEGRLVGS